MAGRLAGKVAIITGATSGIGEATARVFAAEGARLLISGRTADKGQALAQELGAVFQRADVMTEADIAALIGTAVKRYGRLDCLFNNAGAPTPGTLEALTQQELDYAMRLLVGSVLFGMKHAVPVMRAQGSGSIINNASIASHRSAQGPILYSAAKAAVAHITRLSAVELGPHGIRVNAISPGAIATPIFWGGSARANTLSDEENQRKLAKLEHNLAHATPLRRPRVAVLRTATVELARQPAILRRTCGWIVCRRFPIPRAFDAYGAFHADHLRFLSVLWHASPSASVCMPD
jgi:NAD(P)-dependent dehydrogenase (short-subunit alcohol dehydrogenase family)